MSALATQRSWNSAFLLSIVNLTFTKLVYQVPETAALSCDITHLTSHEMLNLGTPK